MVTIRSRKYGKEGLVMLSVRIKDSKHDNAAALGISISASRWDAINETLKQAAAASKRGLSIFIEDQLASKLWQLIRELSARQKAGTLTNAALENAIRQLRPQEDIEQPAMMTAKPSKAGMKPTFTEFIAQYIHECETGERLKQKSTKKIKDSSLKSYRGMLAQVKAYQVDRHCVIDWDDIDFDFYDSFKRFLIEKNYSPNTIARNVKDMKTVLYAAKDMHYTTRDDFMSKKWSADREEVDNIYIPSERLREMLAFDMSDYKEMKERAIKYAKDEKEKKSLLHALRRDVFRRNLNQARDIFIMGCLTGQRVSDYKRINRDMIETIVGDRKFLHIVQTKTGKDVYIPYHEMMDTILDRYDGELPNVQDQHLNERIKIVGLLMGWTEPAGLHEHRGLLQYESPKRFCDAIKTHTARRSFATNSYKAGVPLSAIMAVTGHSSEEMLKRYLKLNTKEKALLAAAEFDKVKVV